MSIDDEAGLRERAREIEGSVVLKVAIVPVCVFYTGRVGMLRTLFSVQTTIFFYRPLLTL